MAMKSINIKGKDYILVNERLKEFRNNFKDYSLITEIIEMGTDFCTMKATIIDDKGVIRATGFAREVVAKSPINKFAFVENCETSAMGRCLGNFGIGIDQAICTAEELLTKLSQDLEQDNPHDHKIISSPAPTPTPQKSLKERYTRCLDIIINNPEWFNDEYKERARVLIEDLRKDGSPDATISAKTLEDAIIKLATNGDELPLWEEYRIC